MCTSLVFLSWVLSLSSYGQVAPNKDRQVVLHHNRVGKTYLFDRSRPKNYNRTEITYLGSVRTAKGQIFKILTSNWYWGLAERGTSRIIIYNGKNQYLGNYYVTMNYDLPTKIAGYKFIFDNKKRIGCDSKLIIKVSLRHGLPKQFFLKCQGVYGDVYSFAGE